MNRRYWSLKHNNQIKDESMTYLDLEYHRIMAAFQASNFIKKKALG